jgi:hypothetical protein
MRERRAHRLTATADAPAVGAALPARAGGYGLEKT